MHQTQKSVATALTACGIETDTGKNFLQTVKDKALQQHLPLAVLKRIGKSIVKPTATLLLQQHLPLAVLKHGKCFRRNLQTR